MSLAGPMLLDPRAFLGDEDVRAMDRLQFGAFLRLLFHQWEEGSIPNDAQRIAWILTEGPRATEPDEIIGASFNQHEQGTLGAPLEGSLWVGLKPCFRVDANDPDRLYNPRCREDRDAWLDKKAQASRDGKAGAKAKKRKALRASRDPESILKGPLKPPLKPPLKDPEASSSSSSSSNQNQKAPSEPVGKATRPLNAQALKIKRIEDYHRENDARPPKPQILAAWLKAMDGDVDRMLDFLGDMHRRGKLGIMEYCGKVVADWSPNGKRRKGRHGLARPAPIEVEAADPEHDRLAEERSDLVRRHGEDSDEVREIEDQLFRFEN